MKCDELEEEYLWTNNVKTPSTIMVRAYNADDVDKAIAELKARIQLDDDEMEGFLQLEEECGGGDLRKYIAELKQKLEDAKASHYAEMVDAGMRESRLRRALWKLKALYFYRMFQWSMEGKRLAPEDDEPEDFFMECMGKHTKRKSKWGKEADMFDDARIVCIKKAEEYKR